MNLVDTNIVYLITVCGYIETHILIIHDRLHSLKIKNSTHAKNMHKYMIITLNCRIVTLMYCNRTCLEEYFTRKYAQRKLDGSVCT
jgi:hypothetical protein